MVDETLILRKISILEEYLSQIEGFRAISAEEYRRDWKTQRIVERTLQMMIETCVDITGHIISDRKLRVPDSYADSFLVLMENQLLSDDLYKTMADISKFRNVIVHQYDRVDAEIVIEILQNRIADFNSFKNAVLNWLKPPPHTKTP